MWQSTIANLYKFCSFVVDRSNENTNPHHVGKTMVAVVVLMLALTVIVLLVVYRDHVIQFLRLVLYDSVFLYIVPWKEH